MKESKSKNLIIEKLRSENEDELVFTINQLRNSGDIKLLPHVIELLNKSNNPTIIKAITDLLNDLKVQAGSNEIIKAISNDNYNSIRKLLFTSCWQSGLNYSEHLEFFIEKFIAENFEIAFEIFTIIENIEEKYDNEIIESMIKKLKISIPDFKDEKSNLIVDLVSILNEKKSNIQ